ncbi:hypothetical protein GF327_01255 [Candidatus Woesearchaeota archaeon]|nr:hypothetical protein [Candidatus Woesearchaeota archaeon]
MGFLEDIFGKKQKQDDKINNSFQRIHDNLSHHNEWIKYLHNNTAKIWENTKELDNRHIRHKQDVFNNIKQINAWIEYLHNNHKELELEISNIENNIKEMIKQDLKKYHEELFLYLEEIAASRINPNELKQEIFDEIDKKDAEKESKTHFVTRETPASYKKKLSGGEQDLLNFLFNEDAPLTYEDISRKMGKSINSIRVYMNSLKSKRDIIDEFKKPNGQKIFSIKNKEKIRTLYNIN